MTQEEAQKQLIEALNAEADAYIEWKDKASKADKLRKEYMELYLLGKKDA